MSSTPGIAVACLAQSVHAQPHACMLHCVTAWRSVGKTQVMDLNMKGGRPVGTCEKTKGSGLL